MIDKGVPPWRLDLEKVEEVIDEALSQREADTESSVAAVGEWADLAREMRSWGTARTYFAAFVCGLIARAADEAAMPKSLRPGSEEGSYAAAAVWHRLQAQAQGVVDLNGLKAEPFNNNPFLRQKQVSPDWRVLKANEPRLRVLNEKLDLVNGMSSVKAREALRYFILALPDPAGDLRLDVSLSSGSVDVKEFFDRVNRFLLDNTENGRRGQALVAACLELVRPGRTEMRPSVHDPSRRAPGDVRVLGESGRAVLAAEAKQKVVGRVDVLDFADDLKKRADGATAAYAALANRRADTRKGAPSSLPGWRDVLERSGVLMSIWDSPDEMMRDALVWSGESVEVGISELARIYSLKLAELHVGTASREKWHSMVGEVGIKIGPS